MTSSQEKIKTCFEFHKNKQQMVTFQQPVIGEKLLPLHLVKKLKVNITIHLAVCLVLLNFKVTIFLKVCSFSLFLLYVFHDNYIIKANKIYIRLSVQMWHINDTNTHDPSSMNMGMRKLTGLACSWIWQKTITAVSFFFGSLKILMQSRFCFVFSIHNKQAWEIIQQIKSHLNVNPDSILLNNK